MKKILLITSILVYSLFGLNAQKVVEQKCVSCHQIKSTMGMMIMSNRKLMNETMQSASEEEKKAIKKKMQEKIKNSGMKAPPMPMISMRLKMKTDSKEAFIAFVKDYVQYPSKEKGFCMPMAYMNFGVMPAMKLSEAELEATAQWLYENHDEKWAESMDGMLCDIDKKASSSSQTK